MIHASRCWDGRTLESALTGALSGIEESALAEHLDHCILCRDRLEALAADRSDWSSVRALKEGGIEGPPFDLDLETEPSQTRDLLLSFLAPTDDPAMLGRLGPYEIQGLIGHGGMGIVLKGFDRALNRSVAIKVLAPQLAASAVARRRFAREARAAAAVLHEHVVPIHAVAEAAGLPYLVMPYFPGKSLQRRIDESGPLGVLEVLRIGRQIAAGLAAAHAQGLVHRDIKPANILLENGVERVVITDFGLARTLDEASLTCSGVIAGTPQYMAPEQARGESIDHRADLFSLGSVLYAMCTGRPPFRAENAIAVLRRICDEHPRPVREINPEAPEWLERIIEKLHAKNAAARYQQAGAIAELLERCLAHVQNPTAIALPAELLGRPHLQPRKRFAGKIWWAAALAALALGMAAAWQIGFGPGDETTSSGAHEGAEATPEPGSASALLADPQGHDAPEQILDRIAAIRGDWSAEPATDWNEFEAQISELRMQAGRLEKDMRREEFEGQTLLYSK